MSHRSLGCAFLALGVAIVAPAAVAAQVPVLLPQGELGARFPAPIRIAAAPGGRLYAVNARGELYMLTPRGDLMLRLALPERGIAVAASTAEVFVSTAGGKILRVDPVAAKVTGAIDLRVSCGPNGLAFDEKKGLLWMAERNAGQLRALRLSGTTAYEIQTAGGRSIRFPGDVALDPANQLVWLLLESNEGYPMAHAFSTVDGAWTRSALVSGLGSGRVSRGAGIAVDTAGYVYGVDGFAAKVQVVDPAGSFVAEAGAFGAAGGQLRLPSGAALLANGDLVVADTDNGRLERFGSGAALPVCPGDSDCDGLPDEWERAHGLNPNDPSDALQDADFDGLTALQEYALGTDPGKRDSDGDGVSDGDEVAAGTDPLQGGAAPVLVASGPASQGPGLVRISSVVQGGADCTAAWTQVGGPGVALRGAATFTPSFVARRPGSYRLSGVATCGGVASLPAAVEVSIVNVAPRADAGRIRVSRVGQPVPMDGSFSSDANGDALELSWEQVLGPAAMLGRAEHGEVVAREPGLFGFQLTAADPASATSSADAALLVLGRRERAAAAQVVSPLTARVGGTVGLDARASFTDGRHARFRWAQAAGPEVALSEPGSATPSFVPPAPGRYAFDVRVESRRRLSPPARVEVFVAAAGAELPRAAAKAVGAASLGEPVALDGSGSAGSGLAFRWRQVAGPAAGLTEADQAVATAVPFTPGAYLFELSVKSGDAESVPAAVAFTVAPAGRALPVAVARVGKARGGHGHAHGRGDRVQLDGRGSSGAARWRWTQVAGPWVALDAPDSAAPWFEARAAGAYAFELEVDDGAVRSAPVRVEIAVRHGKDGGGHGRDGGDDGDDDDGERE